MRQFQSGGNNMIIVRKNANHDYYLVSLNGGLNWIQTSKQANTFESLINALKKLSDNVVIED